MTRSKSARARPGTYCRTSFIYFETLAQGLGERWGCFAGSFSGLRTGSQHDTSLDFFLDFRSLWFYTLGAISGADGISGRAATHLQTRNMPALTRRELLGYIWFTALAALAGAGLQLAARFVQPTALKGQFGGVFDLGPVSGLPAPGSPPHHEPVGRFWLVNTPAGLLSLHKACTHLACLCEWDEQNRQFVCPCHGSRFAEDGTHLEGPAPRSLDRFMLRIETPTGGIVAETDPETGAPLPWPGASASAGGEKAVLVVDTSRVIRGAPAA